MAEGSTVAQLALILWAPICLALFATLRPASAAAISLLGANLLLPKGFAFNFPGVPGLDAERIACLSALLGCILFHPRALRGKRPGRGIELFIVVLALGSVVTALVNPDRLPRGLEGSLPPMSPYDGVSLAASQVLTYGIPFFLGRALVRRWEQIPALLAIVVAAALLYSLPILWEIRMSPRLHAIVYGYSQHQFLQAKRFGGWRPMVFTAHGLALSLFVMISSLAAIGLARLRRTVLGVPAAAAAGYLAILLVLCKSVASIAYGFVVWPIAALARPRNQLRAALLLTVFVLAYPVMRAADVFPREPLLQLTEGFSEDRARSWRTRLDNEEALLEKARDRIWFGWGSWGRNRIYDPIRGRDESLTDGLWILTLSSYGIVGFVCVFGLLLTPVILAQRRVPRLGSVRGRGLVALLALVVAISVADLIPNANITSFTIFMAGALAGVLPSNRAKTRRAPPPALRSGAH